MPKGQYRLRVMKRGCDEVGVVYLYDDEIIQSDGGVTIISL